MSSKLTVERGEKTSTNDISVPLMVKEQTFFGNYKTVSGIMEIYDMFQNEHGPVTNDGLKMTFPFNYGMFGCQCLFLSGL